jgi:putative DNA primase/helicase
MRPDGTVLCRSGYDPTTRLFLTEEWPDLNGNPSRDEARAALDVLVEPYAEFPFVAAEDKSVLAAAIITALQRRLLPSAPLFAFTAPTQRTGKSLLAETVAIIAIGRPAPAMAVSSDREEIRKAAAAASREGHSIVNLDNVEHPLGSPDLSRAITQPEYGDRLLGESHMLQLLTNLTWTATGNNLAFRGDLSVRALACRLDAGVERPEERHFKIVDLKGYIREHRRELVTAAMKILRAYVVAGKPDQGLTPWGGFVEWSATVRAPLVWLGSADPCATREYVIQDDPDRETALALLSAWHDAFGNESVLTARVVERTGSDQNLREAVLAVAAAKNNPGQPDSHRLGWWCCQWRGKVVDGYRLDQAKDYGRRATWRVRHFEGNEGSEVKNPS